MAVPFQVSKWHRQVGQYVEVGSLGWPWPSAMMPLSQKLACHSDKSHFSLLSALNCDNPLSSIWLNNYFMPTDEQMACFTGILSMTSALWLWFFIWQDQNKCATPPFSSHWPIESCCTLSQCVPGGLKGFVYGHMIYMAPVKYIDIL